jgi:glycosyltransferase involved in cell wall biosynthesis
LIKNKELRQKMGESGRNRVLTHFPSGTFEKEIINLFR